MVVSNAGPRQRKSRFKSIMLRSCLACPLTSALESAMPAEAYMVSERSHRREVAGDTIVIEVPSQHAAKPRVLLHDAMMFPSFDLRLEGRQLRNPLLA